MADLRVLFANEPRAYREAIAAAVACLRPGVEVLSVDPVDLDAAVVPNRPQVVVCSHLSDRVRRHAIAWALLYPEGARLAVRGLHGRELVGADLSLADLLDLVDRAERQASGRARLTHFDEPEFTLFRDDPVAGRRHHGTGGNDRSSVTSSMEEPR